MFFFVLLMDVVRVMGGGAPDERGVVADVALGGNGEENGEEAE